MTSPSAPLSFGLCHLVGVPELKDFLSVVFEREPRHTVAALGSRADEILDRDGFERLVASGHASVSVVEGGVARRYVAGARRSALAWIYGAYGAGQTLLHSDVQKLWPPLSDLCRDVENEFITEGVALKDPVRANAYLTPARAQALDIHYDNHCVLVLQLRGTKRWQVFAPPVPLPLARCEQPIARDVAGVPVMVTELSPGDVLYIPRGFPHVARTEADSSLHVTLSIRPVTWGEALEAFCRPHAPFRRSVTPALAHEHFERELLPILRRSRPDELVRRGVSESLSGLEPLPVGRLGAMDDIERLTSDQVVSRVPRTICLAEMEADDAVLRFAGAALRLPAAMMTVFDFIASNEEFTPSALPAINGDYDAVELTRVLVRRGLMRLGHAPCLPTRKIHSGPPPATLKKTGPQKSTGRATIEPGVETGELAPVHDTTLVRHRSEDGSGDAGFHLDWLRGLHPLSEARCDELVEACRELPLVAPSTVGEDRYPGHRQADARKVVPTPGTAWLFDLLSDVAGEAMDRFGLELTEITRAPQYVEYRPGWGHFAWHNDYSHEHANVPRKVTVIVQLSRPEEYEGGRLQVFGVDVDELPRERGTVLVFPSFLYHRVTEVTQGVRRALVAWIAGPRIS